MSFCGNKKGEISLPFAFTIMIIIMILGFILIFSLMAKGVLKADEEEALATCRGSVLLRQVINLGIEHTPLELSPPLLCKTINKELPIIKKDSEKDIQKQIADRMVKCAVEFGEGQVEDPFKIGNYGGHQECFVCYILPLKKTKNFDQPISANDFLGFLLNYKNNVIRDTDYCSADGGKCIPKDQNCKDQTPYIEEEKKPIQGVCSADEKCCIAKTQCENYGGICAGGTEICGQDEAKGYGRENYEWSCESKNKKCCVKEEQFVSYIDYFQKNGIVVAPLIDKIEPGETYALAYGANTRNCDWCKETVKYGSIAVIATVSALVALPSGFTSLAVGGVSIAAILGGGAVVGGVAAGIGYGADTIGDAIEKRDAPTVYLTRYEHMKGKCNVLKDIQGKK